MLSVRQARLSISFFLELGERLERCLFGVFELRQSQRITIFRKKIANLFFL